MGDDVLVTPQRLEGGNCEENRSAGAQYPRNLVDRGLVLLKMLKNVSRKYEVERLSRERQLIGITEDDVSELLAPTELNCIGAEVNSEDVREPKVSKKPEVGPRARSHVKNCRVEWEMKISKKRAEEFTPSNEPPVPLLGGGLTLVGREFHRAT